MPPELTREQTQLCVTEIAAGNPCPGCGREWQPDGSGQRRLAHHPACLYTASIDHWDVTP